MDGESNTQRIHRYVDELNRRNFTVLDELVGERVQLGSLLRAERASPGRTVTRDEYRRDIEERVRSSPDYHVEIEDTIAEGDRVMVYWTSSWTEQGGRIELATISIYRLHEGQIVEVLGYWDAADLAGQLKKGVGSR